VQSLISSVDSRCRAWGAAATSCLVAKIALLSALLALTWALALGELPSPGSPVSAPAATAGVDADGHAGEPSLPPRATSASILMARSHQAPKREFSPNRTPPSALAPVVVPAPAAVPDLVHGRPISQGEPQPVAAQGFEARGPPAIT
jgi:hypothetical protein